VARSASSDAEKAAALVAAKPWLALDWSSTGPYGAARQLTDPRPCEICRKPAWLLSPRTLKPVHHTCAADLHLAVILCGVLRALME
jgi:hypothetical protein